jgi:hypothetical protein
MLLGVCIVVIHSWQEITYASHLLYEAFTECKVEGGE